MMAGDVIKVSYDGEQWPVYHLPVRARGVCFLQRRWGDSYWIAVSKAVTLRRSSHAILVKPLCLAVLVCCEVSISSPHFLVWTTLLLRCTFCCPPLHDHIHSVGRASGNSQMLVKGMRVLSFKYSGGLFFSSYLKAVGDPVVSLRDF